MVMLDDAAQLLIALALTICLTGELLQGVAPSLVLAAPRVPRSAIASRRLCVGAGRPLGRGRAADRAGRPPLGTARAATAEATAEALGRGPCVRFFHKSEPGLWEKLTARILDVARRCSKGQFTRARDLSEAVRRIRYLTNGHSPALEALRHALESAPQRGLCDTQRLLGPTFSKVASLAVELPELFPDGLPMLQNGRSQQLLLTRKHCAALLAAELFGAIPGRSVQENADFVCANEEGRSDGHRLSLPSFDLGFVLEKQEEKVLCLLCYFAQLLDPTSVAAAGGEEDAVVSFARRSTAEEPAVEGGSDFWSALEEPLGPIEIRNSGGIEDCAQYLQADFANEYLGGAVLSDSCVQEEIRFSISPECIVGMLFCEVMLADEALYIVGARQFSRYTGYARSFRFDGPALADADAAADGLRRCGPQIVAFDALRDPGHRQYEEDLILRELVKVRAACMGDLREDAGPRQLGLATGNWGCGAHGGDPQLKALIQWLAASSTGRRILYFPYGDGRMDRFDEVVEALRRSGVRCGGLYKLLQGHSPGGVFGQILRELEPSDVG